VRRIKRATVDYLSFVPRGANKMPVLYKQDTKGDLALEIQTLTKATDNFDEKGELLCVGWVPNVVDAVGDFATKEAVEGMCHSFMQKGAKLDIRHDEKPVGVDRAFVAENFIVQKGDPRFEGWKDYADQPIDATGSWAALIKVLDPALRKLYREGKWNGVSFGSRDYELEPVRKEGTEESMDPEMLKKILAENNAVILKSVDEKIAAIAPKKPEEKPGMFKGDITKLEDVRRHAAELRKQKLAASVDLGDLDAVEALAKQLEDEQAAKLSKETPEQKAERLSKENAQLKVALEKQQKVSSVPATDNGQVPPSALPEGLKKEDLAGMEAGKRIAAIAAANRKAATTFAGK
jgi:hypothetical protein